jgi:hypothetical protein
MVDWLNFTSKASLIFLIGNSRLIFNNNIVFDLIRDLSFGENFGYLDSGSYYSFVASIKKVSKELIFSQILMYYKLLQLR